MKKTDIMERALGMQAGLLEMLRKENVELKKKIADPKWKAGHPEHEEPVLIYRRSWTGAFYYETDRWCSEDNCWNYFINDDVLGWKEIEPFDLEEGE